MMREEMEKVAREHFAKQDAEEEEQSLLMLAEKLGKTRDETLAYLEEVNDMRGRISEFVTQPQGILHYLTPEKTFDVDKFRADCETMIYLATEIFTIDASYFEEENDVEPEPH